MKRKPAAPAPRKHRPHPSGASKAPPSVPVVDPEALVEGETLQEAESELGMNEWLDSQTGEPAEGQSPPRLDDE